MLCPQCGNEIHQAAGAINRALKKGSSLYCGKVCSGLARRKHKTKEQKKEEKRLYDIEFRKKNAERIRERKRLAYQRDRDPVKEAEYRKAHMDRHVRYCQQPQYKAWKKKYDRKYRCKKEFGAFWESASILLDIENEIDNRMSRYEVYQQNGTLNKHQQRRREYDRLISN